MRPLTLVVHGHFYQPPREDPRTGEVPVERGAAPWHDFNAKIASECYHPNLVARVLDNHGRVVDLVDNYEYISFNIGPTLLAWLERNAPETYARLRDSAMRSGHAIAQGFNHAIMPLCNERDLRTQIRWGLADYAYRFGRPAEGMWLPETAVNEHVLEALAEEGVAFTILAPRQADSVRVVGAPADTTWKPVDEWSLDPSVLYRWQHPTRPDLEMRILFYDGSLSNQIAFGLKSLSSEALIDRVEATGMSAPRAGHLVSIATDGETFGHHHSFADLTVAFALSRVAPARGIRVASVADVVRSETPAFDVRVRESSWSCAHGVGRWSADCGCSTGGGPHWHQRWRAPLRAALDRLRDQGIEVFERRGSGIFNDPWKARDAYVGPAIGARTVSDFSEEHLREPHNPESVRVAIELLESQRLAMAMYTSCAWFFNDIAGIEARIGFRFALGMLHRLQAIDESLPMEEFVSILAGAEGNEGKNGDQVWREVLAESDLPAETVPPGGWAPIVNERDRAQELVFDALRNATAISPEAVAALAPFVGVGTPVVHSQGGQDPKGKTAVGS